MPIQDIRFEGGIFYAKEVGLIDEADARRWVDALRTCAAESKKPIVALVDAREVEFVSANASLVFVDGSDTPNVKAAIVVTRSTTTTVKARTIGMMSERHHTHRTYVYTSMVEAERFARSCVREE